MHKHNFIGTYIRNSHTFSTLCTIDSRCDGLLTRNGSEMGTRSAKLLPNIDRTNLNNRECPLGHQASTEQEMEYILN